MLAYQCALISSSVASEVIASALKWGGVEGRFEVGRVLVPGGSFEAVPCFVTALVSSSKSGLTVGELASETAKVGKASRTVSPSRGLNPLWHEGARAGLREVQNVLHTSLLPAAAATFRAP